MSPLRLVPILAVLTALLVPAAAPAAIPAADRAKLHTYALGEAKLLHEKHPTGLRAKKTTWGKVKAALRAGPSYRAKRAVYVLIMHGRFVDSHGTRHSRDLIVYDGKTIKPLISYFDVGFPASLGTPTKV
jgi:hypothetical protein